MNNQIPSFRNPDGFEIDFDMLQEFELGLDTYHPEQSKVPCKVLGYGEMSTVFEIHQETFEGLAFKRMSIFETDAELSDYATIYHEYNRLLEEEIGVHLPVHGYAAFQNQHKRPIFYIIQTKLPSPAIGNKAMHLLPENETLILFECVIRELSKIWMFNQSHTDKMIGLDGQVSNWVIQDFDPMQPVMEADACLAYLDTSSPLLRINGKEQMDPELYLRPAPSFLVWILRILYLKDVVNRYYDLRSVVIDLLANCCKEQKPELIPDLVVMANDYFAKEATDLEVETIGEKEVFSYYKEDAQIWSLYLGMRRIDRGIHRHILRRPYPYVLPGKVKR